MKRLVATLLLLAPAAVWGQPSRLEITPQIGYRLEGDVDVIDDDFLSSAGEIDEGEVFGLTIGFPASHNFQWEILARHQATSLLSDSGLFDRPVRVADIDVTHIHAGVVGQWGAGQVQPFFGASLGIAHLDPDVRGADSEDEFSGSIGGGIKVYFNDHFGLRFEGRGWFTSIDDDVDVDYCDFDCYDYNDSGIYQFEGTVGLIFTF